MTFCYTDGPILTLQVSTPHATHTDGECDIKILNILCFENTKSHQCSYNVNKAIAICHNTTGILSSSQDCANMHPVPIVGGTFIGAGVGVGVFLLLVLLSMAVLIIVVLVVRRKAAYKQKRDVMVRDNLHYNNTTVEKDGIEMKKVQCAYYVDVDNDKGEEKGSLVDGFDPYEDVDRQPQLKNAKRLAPKESAPPASTTSVPAVYAVVDKSKKKGAKKEAKGGCTATNNDQYAMPMEKMGKVTDKGEGVVESGGVEEGAQYNDTVGLRYEPKADKESGQQSEEDSKGPNADVLYAVVDKSRKKKK